MFGGCADRFILFPSRQPEDAGGAVRKIVAFESGELELFAAESPAAGGRRPAAWVLCFVGNASRAEWTAVPVAQTWADLPVEVWAMNPPGYGRSTGPARLGRLGPAALAAFDALKKQAGDRPVFVWGESLGTTLALHVAANRPVAGLVLRTPVPLRDLILGEFGWWNLWLAAGPVAMGVPDGLNSLANARRVNAPAAFILIDDDEVVPVRYQRLVVDAHPGPHKLIERAANHHNGVLTEKAARELDQALRWLWDLTQANPPAPR